MAPQGNRAMVSYVDERSISKEDSTMAQELEEKVALVTGGNSGIGRATAEACDAAGAGVAITGRSGETLKRAQNELGPDALVIQADMSRLSEIEAAMEQVRRKFGRIDVLFVNAGVGRFAPVEEVTEAFFDE